MTIGVPIKDAALRAELEALITEQAYRLDMNCSENLAELYTEDGRLLAPNFDCVGPEAINAYGRERAAAKNRRVRHVCTNFRFWEDGPDQARGLCFILLFRSNGPELSPAEPIARAGSDLANSGAQHRPVVRIRSTQIELIPNGSRREQVFSSRRR